MKYWYISYCATGSPSTHNRSIPCHKVTTETPIEFIKRTNVISRLNDGPYVIMFAMEITESEYRELHGYVG